MNLNDLAKSVARTLIPYLVGLLITLALRAGIDLHGYAPELTFAIGSAYYFLVRVAEVHLSPVFGWLLGAASPPKYAPAAAMTPAVKQAGASPVALLLIVLIVFLAFGLGLAANHLFFLLLLLVVVVLVL